jgi:hypothetical protein
VHILCSANKPVRFGNLLFKTVPLSYVDANVTTLCLSLCHDFSPLRRLADFLAMVSLEDEKMFFELLRFNRACD